jgi:cytochrome P450
MSSDLMRQVGEQANRHNPWPLYAQLRRGRVVPLAEGSYAVGRYDDVLALLHDPRVSSDAHTLTDPGDRVVLDTAPFINRDPPDHDRLHRVATRFFGPPDSPGLVTGQEREVRRQIDALISAFPESGEVDVVDDFAYPLPVAVICRLLGVPPADEPQFRVWAGQVVGALDAANLEDSEDAVKRRNEGLVALFGYLGEPYRPSPVLRGPVHLRVAYDARRTR